MGCGVKLNKKTHMAALLKYSYMVELFAKVLNKMLFLAKDLQQI